MFDDQNGFFWLILYAYFALFGSLLLQILDSCLGIIFASDDSWLTRLGAFEQIKETQKISKLKDCDSHCAKIQKWVSP